MRRDYSAGFTVLELLLALIIIGIVSLPVFNIYMQREYVNKLRPSQFNPLKSLIDQQLEQVQQNKRLVPASILRDMEHVQNGRWYGNLNYRYELVQDETQLILYAAPQNSHFRYEMSFGPIKWVENTKIPLYSHASVVTLEHGNRLHDVVHPKTLFCKSMIVGSSPADLLVDGEAGLSCSEGAKELTAHIR